METNTDWACSGRTYHDPPARHLSALVGQRNTDVGLVGIGESFRRGWSWNGTNLKGPWNWDQSSLSHQPTLAQSWLSGQGQILFQMLAEQDPASVEPRLERGNRDVQCRCGLFGGKPLHVPQDSLIRIDLILALVPEDWKALRIIP